MVDLAVFAKRMRKLGENIQGNANEKARTAARRIVGSLTENTPADSGTAISNWQASLGSAAVGTLPASTPGKGGSTRAANATAARQRAAAVIAAQRPSQTIHITNNLPYIQPLNDGHSEQAPAGFIQTSILEGLQSARAVKLVTGRVVAQ